MNEAPLRGTGDTYTKEKPHRLGPAGLNRSSSSHERTHSAPAPNNQDPRLVVRRGEKTIYRGNVAYETTRNESADARERRKAAGARAGHVLTQMRKWVAYQGLHHPAPEHQEAYLEVAVAQYRAIQASRPRWSYGLMRWVKRYAPDLYRARSAAWIESLVHQQNREGRYLDPAEIGALLGVTREAYMVLRLTDIWPAGMTAEERAQDQRDAKAAWQRTDNLAKGKVKKPHALSLKRTQPWKDLDISESTWKRRRKRGEL